MLYATGKMWAKATKYERMMIRRIEKDATPVYLEAVTKHARRDKHRVLTAAAVYGLRQKTGRKSKRRAR